MTGPRVNWHLLDPPPWDGVFPWDDNHPETSPGEVIKTTSGELVLVTALTSGVLIPTGSGCVEPYLKVTQLQSPYHHLRQTFLWGGWTFPVGKPEEWV